MTQEFKTFISPYDQYSKRNGEQCEVLRELTDKERDPEVGTMYKIRFNDGVMIDARPEELGG